MGWFGSDSVFFLWQAICYFLLTLGLELLPTCKLTPVRLMKWWRRKNFQGDASVLEPFLKSSSESAVLLDEDIDVRTERHRVLSGSIDNIIIFLRNLWKVSPWTLLSLILVMSFWYSYLLLSSNIYQPISGVSWRKALPCKSRFFNFLRSGWRMFWLSGNKWSWKNYHSVNANWYSAIVQLRLQYFIFWTLQNKHSLCQIVLWIYSFNIVE